ncbi:MAG: hypothetical protein QMD09_10890 [Desulfatibacillaceae bacterium]|nr:hypothetical protein [Desulfatibacillaceae bacterium]
MRQPLKKEARQKKIKIVLCLFCLFIFYNVILMLCLTFEISGIEYAQQAIENFRAKNNVKGYKEFNLNSIIKTAGHDFISYQTQTVVSINSYGFRDREFPLDHKPDLRIAALGDSMTFGPDVAQDKVFPKVLERLLKSSHCLQNRFPEIEVINLGNTGTNFKAQLDWYNDVGKQFHPDIVLWQILSNDHLDDQYFYQSYRVLEKKYFNLMPWNYLVLKSAQKIYWRFNPFFAYANKRFANYNEKNTHELINRNFLEPIIYSPSVFGDEVRVFLVPFSLPPVEDGQFAKAAEQVGYDILDLQLLVRLDDPDPGMVLDPALDHHLSELGHEMVAKELFKEMQNRLCAER